MSNYEDEMDIAPLIGFAPSSGRMEKMANFQAIRFAMIDFEGNWINNAIAAGSDVIRYEAETDGGIAVIFEGNIPRTYRFAARAGDVVFVFNDVVHIPAQFHSDEPGNNIPERT